MSQKPTPYFRGWSQFFGKASAAFAHTDPRDVDLPGNPPRVGPALLSEQGPPADPDQPVVVTAHGFAATPFENHYLLDWLCARGFKGSRVMLGAHGESVEAFRKASWRDWQHPLEGELRRLSKLGYRDLSAVTTSTGGTLLLELLSRSHFPALKRLVLIAPIVEPYDRQLRLSSLARRSGVVPSILNTFDEEYIGCWYRELPLSAVEQLDQLTRKVRSQLQQGLKLPSELQILIVQSRREVVVDRRSAFLVSDGLCQNHVELLMLDSHWHLPVLPRSDAREEALKDWVYARVLEFLQRQALPPDRYYGTAQP